MTLIMPLMIAATAVYAVAAPGFAGPIANAERILGLDAGDAWGSVTSGEASTIVVPPKDTTSVASKLLLEGQISHNTAPSPDFDGDGTVGFPDFLAFAGSFGSSRGDARYDPRFDLDGDGSVAFSDFLIFAGAFGSQVPTSGEGGPTTPAADYKPLAGLRVSDGRVQFGFISVGRCIHWNNANVNGVVYTTHTSKWQRKDGQTWVDVSGTERAGLCSYSPSSPGEYRLAAEITINGVRGKYVSENTLSVNGTPGGDGPNEVSVPDVTLRTIITDSLGKPRGAPVTPAEMATLTRLEAYSKSIGDLTGLEAAVNLKRLDLSDNRISNVVPLSGLTRLEFLDLSENSISNVMPLSGLTRLDTLGLGYNSFPSTSALVSVLLNLTNLSVLGIAGNRISDVSALSDLTRLEILDLSDNGISSVSALSYLINLTGLGLSDNSISNVSALSGLIRLEVLDLDNNSISDVSLLSKLTKLSILWLAGNSISNVSALSGLTRLEFLDLDDNSISNVSALSTLRNIEWLWLAGNSISNVSALSGLTRLEWLDLESNQVSDLAPLVANTGMGSGDLLDVRNNPLNATSINVHIPDLRRRGVDVSFGASKPAVSKKKPGLHHAVGEKYGGRWPEAGGIIGD